MTLRTKRILLLSHYLPFVAGVSALAYCVIVTMEARHYQAWAREQLQKPSSDLEALAAPSNPAEFSTEVRRPSPQVGSQLNAEGGCCLRHGTPDRVAFPELRQITFVLWDTFAGGRRLLNVVATDRCSSGSWSKRGSSLCLVRRMWPARHC
jgi:hypothetical protein